MPTITSCAETFGSRDWEETLNSQGVPVLSHTRTFRVVLSSGGAGADAAVANHPSLPQIRDTHPQNPSARAKSRRGRSDANDDKVWLVDIEYDTDTNSQDEQDQQRPENPLDEPWDYDWSFEQFSRPLDKDFDGKAVVNSADEPFDPLPEVDDCRMVLRLTRNEAEYPRALALEYANAVNDDEFLGVSAGYVKAKPVSGAHQWKKLSDGTLFGYWRLTYEFHFRDPSSDEDWDLHLLDQGYREIQDFGGAIGELYLNIWDAEDMPLNKPSLLDGDGGALPVGGAAKYRDFKAYKRKPFSAFNIT